MSEAAAARVASAVLLYQGRGDDLRVLLVERSPELRFFGGYHALPGGVRGPEDGPDVDDSDHEPLRVCGVREMLEETGIALDPGLRELATAARKELRSQLLAGDASGWNAAEIRPDLAVLCRICTPPFAPVRYDTLFLVGELPADEQLEIIPGELVGGQMWRPREALDAWRRGELDIVPPVIILLECFVHGDFERFVGEARTLADSYANGSLHRVRFSPGIIMASLKTPTLPPATTTNTLIVGDERLWIIDPASPHPDEQQRLFDLLEELQSEGHELAGILVTHHHEDHVGAVAATSQRFGLEVRAHRITMDRLAGEFRAGAPIADGDTIELGRTPDGQPGWKLHAIFTPGHDRGHLCFRESRYSAVIAGDMLSTVSTIVIDPPEGHLGTYLGSLQRLVDEPMGTMYPAHGPAAKGGHRIVKRYIRHRAQRETALVTALEEGAETLEALVAKVYWDTDAKLHWLAQRSLLAGLEKLIEDGRVRQEDPDRYVVVR